MTTVKITELSDIGANLASSTVVPVVNMAGTPITQKTNIGNIANLILEGAGVDYAEASVALLAQTVSNAAQPNITSVGTLTNVAVSGNATVNGNITSNGTAYVGNLSTTGLASITTLTVGATANLGAVANVKITGGTAGQVLSTDGAGNLSWASDATTYGNSNVVSLLSAFGSNTITTTGNISGGNVLTSAQVIANGVIDSGTGLTTGGYLSVDGNTDLHNTVVTGNLSATGNITANNLGNISAINLTGSNSNVLYGNGVFAPAAGGGNSSQISNGTSNVNIPTSNGNVVITANGTANWTLDTTGNLTLPDYSVIGLINGANSIGIGASANKTIVLGTNNGVTSFGWSFQPDGTLSLPDDGVIASYSNVGDRSYIGFIGNTTNDVTIGTEHTDNLKINLNQNDTDVLWTFDYSGNVTLPANTFAFNYANGSPVLLGTDTANIGFNGNGIYNTVNQPIIISPSFSGPGNASITIPDNGNAANGQALDIVNLVGNVEIRSGDGSNVAEWSFTNTGVLHLPDGTEFGFSSANVTGIGAPNNYDISFGTNNGVSPSSLTYTSNGVLEMSSAQSRIVGANVSGITSFISFVGNTFPNMVLGTIGPNNVAINVDASNANLVWSFESDGNLKLPGNLVIAGNTNVFGTDSALIQATDGNPLIALSSGANGAIATTWVEDAGNIGTSNIAAVYANPIPGSGIVRIAVGQNGNAGPNLWDFDAAGNLTLPGNTFAVNYANGSPVVISGGGGNTGNVTFDDINIIGTGNLHLQPDPANAGSYLDVFLSSGPDLHLVASAAANLILGKDDGPNVMTSWDGNVYVQSWNTGSNTQGGVWNFGEDGNLVLANGNGVIQSIANSSLDPTLPNVSTMTLTPDANYNSQVLVLDPTAPGHIHLRAYAFSNIDDPAANIFLGGEDTAFEVTSGANNQAVIHSNGKAWTFGNDGNISSDTLTFTTTFANVNTVEYQTAGVWDVYVEDTTTGPNDAWSWINVTFKDNLIDKPEVFIENQKANDGIAQRWTFDENGILNFPRDVAGNTDPYLSIEGGAIPKIQSTDVSLGGPANLAISADYLNLSGFTGDKIVFYADTGEMATDANMTLTTNLANTGNTYSWTFGDDGRLTFPGTPRIDTSTNNFEVQAAEAINFEANTVVNIYTDSGNTAYQWQFGDDGVLTVPGNLAYIGASPAPSINGFNSANFAGNVTGGNISTTGNISGNTNGFTIGYLNIPQVAAANATLALTDAGKHYYSTTAGNFTLTVPNNATTAFATGTAISIVVQAAGNILVNADTGVTLYMAGNSTAANRVVGGYGMATLMKVAADTWFINGTGVS